MPTRKIRRKIRRKRRSIRGGTNLFPRAAAAAARAGTVVREGAAAVVDRSRGLVPKMSSLATSNTNNNKLKYCEDLEKGRMVSKEGNIYFITEIGMANDSFDIKYINISDGVNTSDISGINEISEIKPYNYGDILGKIEILSDIILNDKYLIAKDIKNQNKYIEIIKKIDSIMSTINDLVDYSSNVIHVVVEKGNDCINNPKIFGRLVKYQNEFYYVSEGSVNKDFIIKINDNDSIKIDKDNIKQIEPYNYDGVISSLLSLFKIILEKKYLYNNINENNIGKMKIIKDIIKYLDDIEYLESSGSSSRDDGDG